MDGLTENNPNLVKARYFGVPNPLINNCVLWAY